jgi:uncharacterized protein
LKSIVVILTSFYFLICSSVTAAEFKHPVQFKKVKINLVHKKLKKEILVDFALTPQQHAYGMMNRTKLTANEGMLFEFADSQVREFWMKNTFVDLDIAYIDRNKKVIDIQTMKAVTSVLQTDLPTYPSSGPAQYALEMKSGWFKKNGFSKGTLVSFTTRP